MKVYSRIILLTILISTINHAQWIQQKQEGIETNLTSVHFVNETTGWIAGASNVILKTTDNGTNWTSQTITGYCDFNSVYAVNENTAFAIGWGGGGLGAIFKTTDGGNNWTLHSFDPDIQYMSIYFVNESTGWIAGSGSKILKTTDGGVSWFNQSIGTSDLLWFRSVYFIDQNTGWIVGEKGSIFKTTNGGETWTSQQSNFSNYLYSVFFIDSENGWAVGEFGAISKTTDGGNNWATTNTGGLLHSVYFVDNNNGWAVGLNGKILKTTDGGINWETEDSGTENGLLSICMLDQNTGWAVGYNGEILKANINPPQENLIWNKAGNDLPGGGYSWSTPLIMNGKLFWTGQDKGFAALDAETGDIIWIDTLNFMNGTYDSPVGYNGKVFISNNNYMDPAARNLLALDAETGDVIWKKSNFYTVNRSSKPITAEPSGNGGKLYAASNDTLYCFDINDGSIVWQKAGKFSNLLIDYNGMRLIAAKSDQAVIEILYPHNGELAWSVNLPDPDVSISSMSYTNYFLNDVSKEYLVIAPGTRQKPIFYCLDIAAQNFIWSNDNIGFVGNKAAPVIYQDKVFVGVEKTTSSEPQEIAAFDLLTGNILWRNHARSEGATNTPYVVAVDGKVYYQSSENNMNAIVAAETATGSLTWKTYPEYQNPWPLVWGSPLIYDNKLYSSKDGEGIFCYYIGSVYGEWTMLGGNIHATNSYFAPLVGVEDEKNKLPGGFVLSQNYPNPFNPETKINYQIPAASHVVLKVYDLLGKEVATLVNSFQQPGVYKTEFDASHSERSRGMASGIYFYTLKAGSNFQTKKMIFLK